MSTLAEQLDLVTACMVPAMAVDVAGYGRVEINAADPRYDRLDLVTIDRYGAGTHAYPGHPSARPTAPRPPLAVDVGIEIPVAHLRVPCSAVDIAAHDIEAIL